MVPQHFLNPCSIRDRLTDVLDMPEVLIRYVKDLHICRHMGNQRLVNVSVPSASIDL
jgi:hypothetical protein